MDNYKSFLLFLNNTLETNPWLFCYIISQIFHPGSHQFNNDDWVKQRHCFGEEDLGGGDISMHHSLPERSMHSELIHIAYPGVPGLRAVAPACASNLIDLYCFLKSVPGLMLGQMQLPTSPAFEVPCTLSLLSFGYKICSILHLP